MYDSKFEQIVQQIVKEIQARKGWIHPDLEDTQTDSSVETSKGSKTNLRLLDYACGTGLLSRVRSSPSSFQFTDPSKALIPYITQCIGIDLSANMVAEYNKAAANQGIQSSEMHAVIGNLNSPSDPSPPSLSSVEFFNFDIAAVGFGFHHFDNPVFTAKQLVGRLKPGGVLFIVDFLPHVKMDDYNSPARHTVTHFRFLGRRCEKDI